MFSSTLSNSMFPVYMVIIKGKLYNLTILQLHQSLIIIQLVLMLFLNVIKMIVNVNQNLQ
jgi:hypothetical protein